MIVNEMTIGIVAALTDELAELKGKLQLRSKTLLDRDVAYGYFGHDNNKRIILIESGIGKPLAAAATESLCSIAAFCSAELFGRQSIGKSHNLTGILNFGICGALPGAELEPGEVVVADRICHYDFDISAIDEIEPGQYPGRQSIYFDTDISALPSDLKRVTLASGDKFIADRVQAQQLAAQFKAQICDMEAAGIAVVAEKHGVPLAVIKSVSDAVGGNSQTVQYNRTGRGTAINSLPRIVLQWLETFYKR
jgi:nucleoside phosphorylase